ncbi:hypothetical protein SZN_09236 [Streptomyces zinciresistens K42]|uniref:Uncharacterized protein n=1 Tax=Streptomyces zinciresistens K42 TaxID=700597 RepID=G2G8M9_9ACTN|nr:hypothetical protein [Streptomyces zinciresistens]EGX60094.1 hypothetical protein SZN_09236 [Streptomyces zinciresistens K42]
MATSAVPGVIAELLSILRTPAIPDVDVIDGPPTDDVNTQDLICIGWTPDGDQAAELQQNFNAAGARTRDETIAITGTVDVWSGDSDFAAARGRVFALLGEIEQRIRATGPNPEAPTLNGAVLWAHLTSGALRQSYTDQGARAALSFTVSCHARI